MAWGKLLLVLLALLVGIVWAVGPILTTLGEVAVRFEQTVSLLGRHGLTWEDLRALEEEGLTQVQTLIRTVPMRGVTQLLLVNPIGRVELRGWPPDQGVLTLLVTKRAGTQEALKAVQVEVQTEEEMVRIRTLRPRSLRDSVLVEYVLYVPEGLALTLEQGAGEIHLSDYTGRGSLEVELGVGRVRAERLAAPILHLRLGVGEAQLDLAPSPTLKPEPGSEPNPEPRPFQAHFRLGIGELRLRLPQEASARFQARLGVGEVQVRWPDSDRAKTLWGRHLEVREAWGSSRREAWTLQIQIGIGSLRVDPLP